MSKGSDWMEEAGKIIKGINRPMPDDLIEYDVWQSGQTRADAVRLKSLNPEEVAEKYMRLYGPDGDGEQDGDEHVLRVAVVGDDDIIDVSVITEIQVDYRAEIKSWTGSKANE